MTTLSTATEMDRLERSAAKHLLVVAYTAVAAGFALLLALFRMAVQDDPFAGAITLLVSALFGCIAYWSGRSLRKDLRRIGVLIGDLIGDHDNTSPINQPKDSPESTP